jgi:hypothetical protein
VADVPGVNAFSLVTSGRRFVPSPQSQALLAGERKRIVATYGAQGRQIIRDLQAYANGLTAYFRRSGSPEKPYTVDDAIAVTAFIGSIFGDGGRSGGVQRRLPRPAATPARPGPRRARLHRPDWRSTTPRRPRRRAGNFPYGLGEQRQRRHVPRAAVRAERRGAHARLAPLRLQGQMPGDAER